MGIAIATPQVSRKSNSNIREQSNNEGDGYFSETQLKSEFELLQTLSRLSVKFVKLWPIFLELPWDCVKVREKEKESRWLVFMSSKNPWNWTISCCSLVSLAAVFSIVTQRSSPHRGGGALRDDTKTAARETSCSLAATAKKCTKKNDAPA